MPQPQKKNFLNTPGIIGIVFGKSKIKCVFYLNSTTEFREVDL